LLESDGLINEGDILFMTQEAFSIMSAIRSSDEWSTLISNCRSSGLSDKEWCIENGIAPSSFYYNVRKLRERSCSVPNKTVTKPTVCKQEVIPLRIVDESDINLANLTPDKENKDSGCEIQIEYHDIIIRVSSQAPERCVNSVIKALANLC